MLRKHLMFSQKMGWLDISFFAARQTLLFWLLTAGQGHSQELKNAEAETWQAW